MARGSTRGIVLAVGATAATERTSVADPPLLPTAAAEHAADAPRSNTRSIDRTSARRRVDRSQDTAESSDPAAELRLLERAQRTLPSDPNRTLALTDEHRAQFPTDVLTQEREMLAIEALQRLGRHDAAAKRGRDFRRTYPASHHLARLQDLLRSSR